MCHLWTEYDFFVAYFETTNLQPDCFKVLIDFQMKNWVSRQCYVLLTKFRVFFSYWKIFVGICFLQNIFLPFLEFCKIWPLRNRSFIWSTSNLPNYNFAKLTHYEWVCAWKRPRETYSVSLAPYCNTFYSVKWTYSADSVPGRISKIIQARENMKRIVTCAMCIYEQ